jgi:hypothetical protein
MRCADEPSHTRPRGAARCRAQRRTWLCAALTRGKARSRAIRGAERRAAMTRRAVRRDAKTRGDVRSAALNHATRGAAKQCIAANEAGRGRAKSRGAQSRAAMNGDARCFAATSGAKPDEGQRRTERCGSCREERRAALRRTETSRAVVAMACQAMNDAVPRYGEGQSGDSLRVIGESFCRCDPITGWREFSKADPS